MADFKERNIKFFKEADLDHSGTMNKLELYKVLNRSGCKFTPDQAVRIFDDIDTNDDNVITEEEFLTALGKIPPKDVKEADLRNAFKKFDKDNSGFITLNELKEALQERGIDPSKAVLDMDRNKDGKVNFEEFLESFREKL